MAQMVKEERKYIWCKTNKSKPKNDIKRIEIIVEYTVHVNCCSYIQKN